MSEPVAERLSRFTPNGTALDRDGLLFAAGRASARPNRRWTALSGLLAASQLMTLLLLWPRPAPPAGPPMVAAVTAQPAVQPPPDREESALGALRNRVIAAEGDLPAPASAEQLVPSEPPLHAFAALTSALAE
jgi:hypothetical protein